MSEVRPVRKFHWLHRWTKWQKITITGVPSGHKHEGQIRQCVICGEEKVRDI